MDWKPRAVVIAIALTGLAFAFPTGCWTSESAENGSEQSDNPSAEAQQTQMTGNAKQGKKAREDTGPPLDPGDVPPADSTVELSEAQWQKRLSEQAFHILRESGTERRGTGELLHNKKSGIYYCAGCGNPLYSSRHKYDSGTGWPSYWRAFGEGRVERRPDNSMGMTRTEVVCARCGGHLGHVFDDGPPPTGERHCINSAALEFRPANEDGVVENPPSHDFSSAQTDGSE